MKKNWLLVVSIVAAGLIGGALSNYLLMGTTSVAQERKVISAEEFRLVDAQGRTLADLAVGSKGDVLLGFYGSDGIRRAGFGLSAEGPPVLRLRDEKGRPRAKITLLSDGRPTVRIYDEKGDVRAILGAVNLETPETTRTGTFEKRVESSLVLADKEGKLIWSAPK